MGRIAWTLVLWNEHDDRCDNLLPEVACPLNGPRRSRVHLRSEIRVSKIRRALRRAAIGADRRWDERKQALRRRFGGLGPPRIEPYRSLGRPDRLLLRGRVLVDRGPTLSEQDDDFWDDLGNMYRRLHTTEIVGARVRASAAGASAEALTDTEGYFEVELPAADREFSAPIQEVDLELVESEDGPARALGEAVVRSAASRFLVISDVDDTVVRTHATHLLAMARATFLGNARSRAAFPGVAALYSALVEGAAGAEHNPLVFVSRSPWNLYDLFDEFCTLQGIPHGRVFVLRDWGFSAEGLTRARERGHKFKQIQRILEFEPDLPVLLIGDSGQKDAEIYAELVREAPGRILAAFIRDVTRHAERGAAIEELAVQVKADGGALHLVDDSLGIAQEVAEMGLIAAEVVAKVAADVEFDRKPPTELEELLHEERPSGSN